MYIPTWNCDTHACLIINLQVRAELGHHGRLDSQEIESAEELGDKAVSLPVGEAIGDRTYQGGAVEDGGELRPEALSPEATLTHEGSSSGQLYAQHMADPKLHRALEKMKKLDARLADLTKARRTHTHPRRTHTPHNLTVYTVVLFYLLSSLL